MDTLKLNNFNLIEEKEVIIKSKDDQITLVTQNFTDEIKLNDHQWNNQLREKVEIILVKDDQIKLEENQLADKENQINDLINQLIDTEKQKEELTNHIKELSNQLIEKNNQIIVKDDQIKEKDVQINHLINQLNENRNRIFSKNSDKYSEEEKEQRNKMIFSNQLIQNQNLLSHFGSIGTDPFTNFNYPYDITYNDNLNIIAVSDCNNNSVKIMDKKGALIQCFPFQSPTGIAIIPSLSLLAVSSSSKQVIESSLDISPHLPNIHNNNNHPLNNNNNNNNNNKREEGVPLLYNIGNEYGGGRGDHFHFNNPKGIGYSEGKGILAISDYGNQRIEIYKIRMDGYEHHSFISLTFNPNEIAISSPAISSL